MESSSQEYDKNLTVGQIISARQAHQVRFFMGEFSWAVKSKPKPGGKVTAEKEDEILKC